MIRKKYLETLTFIVFLTIILSFTSCGGPAITKETISKDLYDILPNIDYSKKQFLDANIILSVKGEKHSARFQANILDSSRLEFKIYSFILGDLVTLKSTSDSLHLKYENRKVSVARADGLKKLPFFSNYPFSFPLFTRILTGRLPFTSKNIIEYGKFSENEDHSTIRLEKEDLYLKLNLEGRKLNKTFAQITSSKNDGWKLKYENFNNYKFEKVTFNDEQGNGFTLTFKN